MNEKIEGNAYRILVKGDGGEFVIGEISDEAFKYWSSRDQDELSAYVANPDGSQFEPKEEAYRLEPWRELGDFVHAYGIESIEQLIVEDAEGNELHNLTNDQVREIGITVHADVNEKRSMDDYKGSVIFTRSREKGYCIYPLTTTEPFDISKLKLTEVDVWDHELVTALSYGEDELEMEEGFGREYADVSVQLTAPID